MTVLRSSKSGLLTGLGLVATMAVVVGLLGFFGVDGVSEWSEALPRSPLSGRLGPLVNWTGAEFLVVGGRVQSAPQTTVPSAEAAAFNPTTDRWRRLPDAPQPISEVAGAAWTGTELVVIENGPLVSGAAGTPNLAGVAYSPTTNRWRRIAASALRPRDNAFTTWTGAELLVWGGDDTDAPDGRGVGDGAAYNPATDTWRGLPAAPRERGFGGISAWIRDRWVIGGGENGTDGGTDYGWLAYRPANNTWQRLSDPAWLNGDLIHDSALLAGRLYVWPSGTAAFGRPESPGAVLDLPAGTWNRVAPIPNRLKNFDGTPIVLAGSTGVVFVHADLLRSQWRTARYDPSVDAWTDLAGPPVPPRQDAGVAQGGRQLFLWGGGNGPSAFLNPRDDGALLTSPAR